MKVSINWLKELVDLNISAEELVKLLPLRTIGTKEATEDFIELDMKGYNRADLLSLRGVALEVTAITDSAVKFIETKDNEYIFSQQNLPKLNVEVKDPKLAPVYCLVKIENLKVEDSNKDWVKKLSDSGFRSINNIADVTNLVMLEYGQPLHAFDSGLIDADASDNKKIIVRTAKAQEQIITLDNKTRTLNSDDLLITDPKKAVGIAGVMGGKNSEISDNTQAIFLEAAIFDPAALRKTSTKLGLTSEASKRFYHGLTKIRLFQALNQAIKMYQNLGGKLTAITIIDHFEQVQKRVLLTQQKVNSLIGVDIPEDKIADYLIRLGFTLDQFEKGVWGVTAPYWRLDIQIEEDLIEEVARMYGYEKIPAKSLPGEAPKSIDQSQFNLTYNLKNTLVELGLTEVNTYPYYSTKTLETLGFSGKNLNNLVKVTNPISAETQYLRQNLWPNLIEIISKNLKQGFLDLAIFELGKIYFIDEKQQIFENYSLAIALLNGGNNPTKELFAIFNKLNQKLSLNIKVEAKKATGADLGLFHPSRFVQLISDDKLLGKLAEVHQRLTDKFGISNRIAVLEVGINLLN
ncbi:phenylalanine--tRNA ligase subunit beta [Candidatus Daviesbacteria bacterium]|nr:phenylalanine--tRNA ligase subunit beta [Candidatus Daviesbacteria bacterium]